jgi:hypothetical protein
MKRNGFRWRFVIGPETDGQAFEIAIQILYCKRCRKVTSVLPSFCVPYKSHTVSTFKKFFVYLFFTTLSLSQVVGKARGFNGSYQAAQAWVRSFKNNNINLTAELRTLTGINSSAKNISPPSGRHKDLFSAWQMLGKLARQSALQALSIKPSLEKVQYFLWQNRKLGLFRCTG